MPNRYKKSVFSIAPATGRTSRRRAVWLVGQVAVDRTNAGIRPLVGSPATEDTPAAADRPVRKPEAKPGCSVRQGNRPEREPDQKADT